jgi:hypothetical protein
MGKRIGFINLANRLFDVVFDDCSDSLWHMHVYRTDVITPAALYTTGSFNDGLLFIHGCLPSLLFR